VARSSLRSFLRHGCGAPRPLAHELSGFVADRSSPDSSPGDRDEGGATAALRRS
jgi:hypothetical protein